MTCTQKQTRHQPQDAEWVCPDCGATGVEGEFTVDAGSCVDDACEALHENDRVYCDACDAEWSGEEIARIMEEKRDLVDCPHCKGTGRVKKGDSCGGR